MEKTRARMHDFDENLFYRFNCREGQLLTSFHMITHLGGARCIVGSMLFLLLLAAPDTLLKKTVWVSAASLLISHIIAAIIKRVVKRVRPYMSLPDVKLYGYAFQDHSFPSGHTTAIFSITVPFIIHYPLLIWILLPASLLVALSRVVLGVHYPSDVLAGGILGTATALWALLAF
ncbi:PAP2 family protein [Bacillus salacetis]|uniref:PAP2 family protein n=1 Tax=Bacillus salacetis TaxID=2315464 RepID=A0A3A1QMC1_9BACI|nr:phosphatase PAP2 family protein [Bacillus salacetis]RIW28002.1 PAP2 family protein [Bacillus salacetis]